MMKKIIASAILLTAALGLSACQDDGPKQSVTLLSGSENKSLYPIVEAFAKKQGVDIHIKGRGSVDIMLDIRSGTKAEADIVWPAASLWLELGDTQKVVKHEKSIMRSPVVFWVKKEKAKELNWIGKDTSLTDIVEASEAGLTFGMTSATQSNSGAMSYFAMLSSAAGQPNVLSLKDIENTDVQSRVERLLKRVDRTSGSSGWLGDLYLEHPDAMDAMFNYEAVGIEVNRELEKQGKEPLCAIYPVDGIAIADSPLAYIDKGDSEEDKAKEAFFLKLQEHLLSDDVQAELAASGRRVGPLGLSSSTLSKDVFKPDWCINLDRSINALNLPSQKVIEAALRLYQGTSRRPSEIAFLLDYSGSMKGEGNEQMVSSLANLFLEEKARDFFLETTKGDIFYVIPFNGLAGEPVSATGASNEEMAALYDYVQRLLPDGGTNIYTAVSKGLSVLQNSGNGKTHSQMVLLLTDGVSDGDLADIQYLFDPSPARNIPVFSILFGDASEDQVKKLAELTAARVFDGRKGLVTAFRNARGYAN
ncbi:substrate-binding and VWA domain-containing protein [uncultured Cohaesibacter sp.]|uniref:substrate-binding and VWA domain-containing protein n=1 Tax=uncultured Cohaesibacter sp. TaxID=1002546 RepID=UPI00292F511D|nr:substrate-binding and VWA domain-containing protein [uncultured Cohaesibacter sp.]